MLYKIKMARKMLILLIAVISVVRGEEDLKDFDFATSGVGQEKEMMIAQESRQYQTMVKAPIRIVKPIGITNSHRPQYNLDSFEDDYIEKKYRGNEADELIDFFEEPTTKRSVEKDYKQNFKFRSKEAMIRDAVLRALERKDHVGKFAQILPIIRAMSGSQRIALASLVASQVTTPPGRSPLNLAQVRSMFGNNNITTSNLMLPILLDTANLIRRSVRSNKETREVKEPPPQIQRRSFTEDDDTHLDDEFFEKGYETDTTSTTTKTPKPTNTQMRLRNTNRIRPQKATNKTDSDKDTKTNITTESIIENKNTTRENTTNETIEDNLKLFSNTSSLKITQPPILMKPKLANVSKNRSDNSSSMDLTAESTNHTVSQNLPVAEKLRAFNRYVDRNGNVIRRGQWPPNKPSAPVTRRTTPEAALTTLRRRPAPARKLPATDHSKCELFTNSLCLHSDDYPTDAILQSIRRNKAAAGALLADFRDPGEGAVDGVTAAQEAKYTAEHYLTSNRRGDTANRDFAGAGEAGFMCPSTVKYARPQRARATSGQWKYIVNTGEHTQTLRLEKCLKPKESCTYLTDNFKSKCVQVYNYHRLLTWDQQNGLHMDIFKVPTCCSCHIEGYSVAFPPLGHRAHDTSSEQFPGEDLSAEHGNNAFESVQSSIQRPSITKKTPFALSKPLESFPAFGDNHNLISGASFGTGKLSDNEDFNNGNIPGTGPMDSYGNAYFPDSFNQASSIRNIKRPASGRPASPPSDIDSVTLPSYLEPPTPSSGSSFSFGTDKLSKLKSTNSNFKRGPPRPSRRPIRKKITTSPDDLMSSGTSAVESLSNMESLEDFNEDHEEIDIQESVSKRVTVPPKIFVTPPSTFIEKTTSKPLNGNKPITRESPISSGKRVNYNYHPIIDFFDNDERDGDSETAMDRDDSIPSFIPESEWKPINHPITRGTQSSNQIGRKKHK